MTRFDSVLEFFSFFHIFVKPTWFTRTKNISDHSNTFFQIFIKGFQILREINANLHVFQKQLFKVFLSQELRIFPLKIILVHIKELNRVSNIIT